MVLDRERELMKQHIKKVGWLRLLLTYLFVLLMIVIVEAFASLNIYLLKDAPGGIPILREVFSVIAIIVAAFTVIANIVFLGGRTKAEREFHYYFGTRPLILYSSTAIVGDMFAVYLVGRTSFAYIVFFTSLLAINLFAIGFAIYSAEKAIKEFVNY